jgi:hypothetical protein
MVGQDICTFLTALKPTLPPMIFCAGGLGNTHAELATPDHLDLTARQLDTPMSTTEPPPALNGKLCS